MSLAARVRPATLVLLFPLAALLLVLRPAAAQQVATFADLPLHVDLDDRVRIVSTSSSPAIGRLADLTRDAIVVRTRAGERRFTAADVRSVVVRRHPIRGAVLVGAALAAAAGTLAACVPADRSECGDAWLLAGAAGAGAGAAVGALIRRDTTVYATTSPPAETAATARVSGPLEAVALRVDLGDRIETVDTHGRKLAGRLKALGGADMTIATRGGDELIAAASVQSVRVRTHRLGQAALIGAAALTAVIAVAPGCRDRDSCQPLAGVPIGAGLGLAVGALVPRMTQVYGSTSTDIALVPAFSRGGMGVLASLRW